MGEFIIAAAHAFGLKHPHVVAPRTGTAAALFAAARHPGRFRSLVVGSGAAAVPLQVGEMVKDIIEAPGLDGFRRGDPRQFVDAALSGISRYTLPESIRDDYLASYQGDRFAGSARYLRAYPAELPVLAGLLPQIDTPVQIIAGAGDTVVPPVKRHVPVRAAAAQQARHHRHGPLHLGRRRKRIRGAGNQPGWLRVDREDQPAASQQLQRIGALAAAQVDRLAALAGAELLAGGQQQRPRLTAS